MMREQDIGAIPVGENDRLIGMVTDRDIALRAVADGKDISRLTARNVMTKGIAWCRDTDDVSQALQVMGSKQVRRLPVIDKNKRMVGILSLGDLDAYGIVTDRGRCGKGGLGPSRLNETSSPGARPLMRIRNL